MHKVTKTVQNIFIIFKELISKMAAAGDEFYGWRTLLNNHSISRYLRKQTDSGASKEQSKDAKSLICIQSSDLFIWSASERCILHCNLKALATDQAQTESESVKARSHTFGVDGSSVQSCTFQKLFPVEISSSEVESISINKSGSHILLYGARIIRIIELPRRWGKNAVFEGGKESISCKTIRMGDEMLTRGQSLRILQVSWHPGSKTNSHVAVLTSNNRFCVYSILDAEQPISSVLISAGDGALDASPSKNFVGAALGEVAVAFDFSTPITLKGRQRALSGSTGLGGKVVSPIEVWPVYCVRGNGAVMLTSYLFHVWPRPVNLLVQGPLIMYPPADDNYGSVPEPTLYVIETAVLELCLSVPQLDDLSVTEDEFMCPVMLRKDANSPDRYHCSHAAGVHSVALPWLSSVQQYFLGELLECVVEHVMCTKPLFSCPTSPVLGLDVVTDPQLGATLIILSSDLEFTVLPIGLQYQVTSPSRSARSAANSTQTSISLQQVASRQPFKTQLEQILHRKSSVPILKSGTNAELSQRDMFQLLSRVTSVLREEYIHKQDHARQELHTRVSMLQQLKSHQLQDIESLLASRN
ncbi:hypothetical protein EGW08_013045, partial [Elysia chlorotica]